MILELLNVDAFFGAGFTSEGRGYAQRSPVGVSHRLFYKVVPTPRSTSVSVKVLVKITTAD